MEGAAASSARWGDREGKDVERPWRWLRTQSGVDREDGVLVGASLGGAAVLRAAAAAGESGVSQAILLAPASDLHAIVDWRMHWLGSIAPVFGNLVEWHLSGLGVRLLSSSPSPAQTFARNALPPQLLVFHGDSDKKIPTSLSQDVAAGIPGSRLGVLRGVGHDDIPGFVARDSAAWAEVQRVLEGY